MTRDRYFRHGQNHGHGHVLLARGDGKEKEGPLPRLHVGRPQT